jgi:hypothetical protein
VSPQFLNDFVWVLPGLVAEISYVSVEGRGTDSLPQANFPSVFHELYMVSWFDTEFGLDFPWHGN